MTSRKGTRRSDRRWAATFAVLLLAAAAAGGLLSTVPPAAAVASESSRVQVSRDGLAFAPTLDAPLFDNPPALVPQEQESRTLWIRNTSDSDTQVRVSVRDIETSSSALAESLTVTTTDRTGELSSYSAAALEDCTTLAPSTLIPAGETLVLNIRIRMKDVADQVAQEEWMRFSANIDAQDAAAGPLPDDGCDDAGASDSNGVPIIGEPSGSGTADPLAVTGSEPSLYVFVAGVALLGFGALLRLSRRRRRPHPTPEAADSESPAKQPGAPVHD